MSLLSASLGPILSKTCLVYRDPMEKSGPRMMAALFAAFPLSEAARFIRGSSRADSQPHPGIGSCSREGGAISDADSIRYVLCFISATLLGAFAFSFEGVLHSAKSCDAKIRLLACCTASSQSFPEADPGHFLQNLMPIWLHELAAGSFGPVFADPGSGREKQRAALAVSPVAGLRKQTAIVSYSIAFVVEDPTVVAIYAVCGLHCRYVSAGI